MNQNELFEKFTKELKTKEQLIILLDEIETASSFIYKEAGGQLISGRLKDHVSESFLANLEWSEKNGYISSELEAQKDFFNQLKKFAQGLPICKLTLAFNPRPDFLSKISDWINKETGKRIILDIYTNENILAGASIEFEGNYRDFSFGGQLSEVISKRSLI
jgi:F0F1-type ATP synthase delta subunit